MLINASSNECLIERGFYQNLSVKFRLPKRPVYFRSFKYTWEKANSIQISGPLSPKILKFEDGGCLMANRYLGTWVYNPVKPFELEWIIFGENVQPFFRYDSNHIREWIEVGGNIEDDIVLKLIETNSPIEVSFSKLPFKPVVVFTDHCDFDSDLLLSKQRDFFKKYSIRTTKGFFLKKYSNKGVWNSAYEGNENEYGKWLADGHELCYHSLSQSKLPNNESNHELFLGFKNPFDHADIVTWIDHGYQEYNVSKSKDSVDRSFRLKHLVDKGIRFIWNYNDTGEVIDNLNQLDYNQTAPRRILLNPILSKVDKIRLLLFYNTSESVLMEYRKLSVFVKQRLILKLALNIPILVLASLRGLKKVPESMKISRSQVVFPSENTVILGFQTIVVKDWKHAFGPPYNKLIEEKGIAIIHSYFSFLGKHHRHPMFKNENGEISREIDEAFSILSQDIKNGTVWNPTLSEFIEQLKLFNFIDLRNYLLDSCFDDFWRGGLIRYVV